jgi:hypothetical protein
MVAICGLTVLYVVATELAKKVFYGRERAGSPVAHGESREAHAEEYTVPPGPPAVSRR